MKRRPFCFSNCRLLLWIILLGFPFLSLAQNANQQLPFALVDFMKVDPGNEADYLRMEQVTWKHIHQQRVNQGQLLGWYLYQISFTGTNSPYNYATVAIFPSMEQVEKNIPEEAFQAALEGPLAGRTVNEIGEEANRTRNLVSSFLLHQISVVNDDDEEPAPYIEVNYMHITPETEANYVSLEKEIWQPIHKALTDMGYEAGWSAWEVRFPRGYGEPFQYATVNSYADFTNIGPLPVQEAFTAAHSDKDFQETMDRTEAARDMVKTELWTLIDYVEASPSMTDND